MAGVSKDLMAYTDPKSPTSEAIRCLRTNIRFLNAEKKPQVITVTSPAPQEGKSLIIGNLAVVTAQSNKKTLLIDCDLRRPSLDKLFGIDVKRGLSNALAEKELSSLEAFPLYDVGIENLALLPSGPIAHNPAELLEGESMDKLLSAAKEEFDIIYIDTPPVLSVTDPIIISKKSDGVILVAMADLTLTKALVRSYNLLKEAGAHIIGTVLNKVNIATEGHYYRYRYYYEK